MAAHHGLIEEGESRNYTYDHICLFLHDVLSYLRILAGNKKVIMITWSSSRSWFRTKPKINLIFLYHLPRKIILIELRVAIVFSIVQYQKALRQHHFSGVLFISWISGGVENIFTWKHSQVSGKYWRGKIKNIAC